MVAGAAGERRRTCGSLHLTFGTGCSPTTATGTGDLLHSLPFDCGERTDPTSSIDRRPSPVIAVLFLRSVLFRKLLMELRERSQRFGRFT